MTGLIEGFPGDASSFRGTMAVVSSSDLRFGDRIDAGVARRQCDCRTCVRHAIEINTRTSFVAAPPSTVPKVRFLQLPGLFLDPASTAEQCYLVNVLVAEPERSLSVCGCPPCSLHRSFVRAWLLAHRLTSSGGRVVATAT